MSIFTNADKLIKHSIMVNAPSAAVWDCWTTEEGIRSFFAEDCRIDLRIGGAYEMYFRKDLPEGQRGSEGCVILSYVPGRMLSFDWNAPNEFPEVRKERTWVVIQLQATENKQTQVELFHLGWQEGEEWEDVFDYFDNAWQRVLAWLKRYFEQDKPQYWYNT
ncbi:MAG: SRPBCC domain-containing protein [Bacteroidota bacterium]